MNFPEEKKLQDELKTWQVSSPLPPRFQANVWRRIEQAEIQPRLALGDFWRGWRTCLQVAFVRRAMACAYLAAAVMLGVARGYSDGSAKQGRFNQELAARYVQMVDPNLKSH